MITKTHRPACALAILVLLGLAAPALAQSPDGRSAPIAAHLRLDPAGEPVLVLENIGAAPFAMTEPTAAPSPPTVAVPAPPPAPSEATDPQPFLDELARLQLRELGTRVPLFSRRFAPRSAEDDELEQGLDNVARLALVQARIAQLEQQLLRLGVTPPQISPQMPPLQIDTAGVGMTFRRDRSISELYGTAYGVSRLQLTIGAAEGIELLPLYAETEPAVALEDDGVVMGLGDGTEERVLVSR